MLVLRKEGARVCYREKMRYMRERSHSQTWREWLKGLIEDNHERQRIAKEFDYDTSSPALRQRRKYVSQ